ncbi:MAG: hypothetical protein N2378_00050, partial [Chloroflexaceae bacterium]|nr:hypothetical protein [Chloroflexaceae bacterium]
DVYKRQALQRREDDAPFLRGAHGSEPPERVRAPDDPRGYVWWWEALERTGGRPYRWMRPEAAIVLPGAGGGLHVVSLLAAGSPNSTATVWETGLGTPYTLTLPPGEPRRYYLLARSNGAGDLRVSMRSTPFAAPGDPRDLSFVLFEVRQHSAGGLPRAPAWPALAWLALTVAMIFTLARGLGAGRRGTLMLAGGAVLSAAWLLAFHRLALTVFAPNLGALALGCASLAAVALLLVEPRAGPAARPVIGLMVMAFALRLGGMLHPQALFSDLGLHANNLFKVTLGMVFFTTGLPGDAGGGQQPYPPGTYLLLLPGQLIASGDTARRILVQGGVALLDVLSIGLIWALLGRAGFSRRARLLGAILYLLPTPALESFSIGEYANLGGQALALPLLAMLGLGLAGAHALAQPPAGGRVWPLAALTVAVALGLLGHSGVTLSVGTLIAAAWLFAWATRLSGRTPAISLLGLTLAGAIGLGVVLLIFYSAPIFVAALVERGGSGGGTPLPRVLGDTLAALAGLAPPQGARVKLPPLIGPLAGAGLALVLLRRHPRAAPLRALLAAWWTGVALSLGLLVVAGQGVRWALFLYPALCVSAGPLLAALARRGRGGRVVALATVALVLVAGLGAWIAQIRDYIHT